MDIWKKKYVLRRYGKQRSRKGYFTRGYTEFSVFLDVQTVNSSATLTKEGRRATKEIKAFGRAQLQAADVKTGVQGDRLFFDGEWYECTSCVRREHTPLAHYRSQFTLVSEAVHPTDTTEPQIDPTEGDCL